METTEAMTRRTIPQWLLAALPLLLVAAVLLVFATADPLRFFTGSIPPVELLNIQQVRFPEKGQIELSVVNGGPHPVAIAQVLVDDAYWQYEIHPDRELNRLEEATISLAYPWVEGEPLPIRLITATGVTFDSEVEVVVESPQADGGSFVAFGLLGVYVGVIPVGLGMLWYPFMRRTRRKWVNAFLALTVGLLLFLLADTVLEALEIAEELPGVLQGVPLVFFGILLALGTLLAVSQRRGQGTPAATATFIALGIGLHNMGEGLAIGAAFATGAAALGSFLVIGFTLHNITEGVGIAAPLTGLDRPGWGLFVRLALLAGAPAILGTWIGGFAFSPFLAVLFLSLGAGAILQVIYEVGRLLWQDARRQGEAAMSWLNVASAMTGILVMYVTAFLVKF